MDLVYIRIIICSRVDRKGYCDSSVYAPGRFATTMYLYIGMNLGDNRKTTAPVRFATVDSPLGI